MSKRETYRLAFAAAVAALFVTGTPVRAAAMDTAIESAFENTFVYRTYLKDDSVKFKANDGVVTLTGTVADQSHKALAEDTAERLPGVTRVINELATTAEVEAENADTLIRRKVTLALLLHRNVNARGTTVQVEDGVVTLTGSATSLAQKELTTAYAQDIENVKEVRNEMTVTATPEAEERTAQEKVDDASITAQVKQALSTHRSTSAITTKVDTRDGVVSLTGIAKNKAEKSLVTKLISDIQGVTSVKNEMTIEVAKSE